MTILRIISPLFMFWYFWKYREIKHTRVHRQYQKSRKKTREKKYIYSIVKLKLIKFFSFIKEIYQPYWFQILDIWNSFSLTNMKNVLEKAFIYNSIGYELVVLVRQRRKILTMLFHFCLLLLLPECIFVVIELCFHSIPTFMWKQKIPLWWVNYSSLSQII